LKIEIFNNEITFSQCIIFFYSHKGKNTAQTKKTKMYDQKNIVSERLQYYFAKFYLREMDFEENLHLGWLLLSKKFKKFNLIDNSQDQMILDIT